MSVFLTLRGPASLLQSQREGPRGGSSMLPSPQRLGVAYRFDGLRAQAREHPGDRQRYALARVIGDTPQTKARGLCGHSSSSTKRPLAMPAAGRLQRDIL